MDHHAASSSPFTLYSGEEGRVKLNRENLFFFFFPPEIALLSFAEFGVKCREQTAYASGQLTFNSAKDFPWGD